MEVKRLRKGGRASFRSSILKCRHPERRREKGFLLNGRVYRAAVEGPCWHELAMLVARKDMDLRGRLIAWLESGMGAFHGERFPALHDLLVSRG